MSNDVALFANLPVAKYDDSLFDQVAKSSKYLPRLQLFTAGSDAVKGDKLPVGYALVEGKDTYTALGKDVDVFVLAWRPKAINMGGDPIVASHDVTSPVFQEIRERADAGGQSGCMYGPEYLVYIPTLAKFATYLMGNPTARNEAPKMKGRLHKAATLKTKLYSNAKNKWHGPEVIACSTPFPLPDEADVVKQIDAFLNPPATVAPEAAPAIENGRAR